MSLLWDARLIWVKQVLNDQNLTLNSDAAQYYKAIGSAYSSVKTALQNQEYIIVGNVQDPNTNEPAHDKTYKMACAHSEDSDQPGHPPSLIRVFAVRSIGS